MYLIQYSSNGRPFTVHLDLHSVRSKEEALTYSRNTLQSVLEREGDVVDFSLVRIDSISKEVWTAVYGAEGSRDLDYEIEQDRIRKEELEAGNGPVN